MKLQTINLFSIFLLFAKSFSLIVYFKYQLFYVDDYVDYISSSEGNFTPTNPKHNKYTDRELSYAFNFNDIKHNFDKPLCIYLVNLLQVGCFAFKYATINEYDIRVIDYEKYYYCNNCNINTQKKFKTTSEKYSNGSPKIHTSEYDQSVKVRYNEFCLNKTKDISIFFVDKSKINTKFYKGKNLKYILNNEVDNFNINNSFVINGKENYIFDLNTVSIKVINITNKLGNIFNKEEELFTNSFFNSENNYLIHKKITDEGYLMTISIVTMPRNQKSANIITCENESNIYLYVAQKNCTMNESSDDYCQNCMPDYGKYENKCYHKSEKFDDLYYENSTQTWNKCESMEINFTCSICPKGSFIQDSFTQTCEKCQIGEYSDSEDKISCEKCPIGYYSDEIGAITCKKCPDGYTSIIGADKCYKDCEAGYYSIGDECLPCQPGYYSLPSSTECIECIPGTYSDKEGMEECLKCEPGTFNNEYKSISCINCPIGYFSSLEGSTKCSECIPGTYSNKEGMEECLKCEPGTFNNEYKQTICIKCPMGYFSPLEGSTKCSECIPGTYSNKEGMEECLKCEPGTYNNEYKQTSCIECPVGYFSSLNGSKECIKCPLGTFNSLLGNYQCEKCDFGYYNDELGSKECKICQPNFYSDENGSLFCKECELNKYSLFGFKECLICEEAISHCNSCSKQGICLECNNYAISGFNNCSMCENEIDWKFTGEYCQLITNCSNYYYKDKNNNNKIICVENIKECPEGMNYLNLDTKECLEKEKVSPMDFLNFQFKIKGGEESLNKIADEIFEYIEFDELYQEIKRRNEIKKIKVEGLNAKLLIGTEENLKKQNGEDIGFDNGKCSDIIRFSLGIQNNYNDLIYKVFELHVNGTKIVKYYAYDTNDLKTPLDLTSCEGQTVKIINPPTNYDFEIPEEFYDVINILNDNIEIYNAYSPLYTDPCYPLSILDKYDIILSDRKEYIDKKKIPLCEKGCEYEGDNLKNLQVICYCPIKTNMNETSINSFVNDTIYYTLGFNYKILKCYKFTFSLEGQKKNWFSELFIFFFTMNICLIIMNEIYLKIYLYNLITYCKEFIDKNNNKQFEKMRDINSNSNKINGKEVNTNKKRFRRFINERIVNNPNKKVKKRDLSNHKDILISPISINSHSNNIHINGNKIDPEKYMLSNILIRKYIKRQLFKKIKSINKYDEYKNYYIYLIYAYPKEKRKNFLIEEELMDLEYDHYRHIEDRKWYMIFWSIFKLNYDFAKTFLIYNNSEKYKNYQLYLIKIIIYMNSLIISIISNLMFYSDKTMHKIYEDNGEYIFWYRIPRIVFSDAFMKLFSFLVFDLLINFHEKFIELKINIKTFENEKIELEKFKLNNDKFENKNINNKIDNNNKLNIIYNTSNEDILNEKTSTLKDTTPSNSARKFLISDSQFFKNETLSKIDLNKDIISVEQNKSKIKEDININDLASKIEISFRSRRIFFYIIIFSLNIFGWYYISCFCSVYENTQKHLFKDFLFSIPFNFIICFIISNIFFIIKIFIIKGKYHRAKKRIISLINNDFFKFVFEEVIEIAVALIVYYLN